MKLYVLNDTAYIGDRYIPLMCSNTSHYLLPMTKWDLEVGKTYYFAYTVAHATKEKL